MLALCWLMYQREVKSIREATIAEASASTQLQSRLFEQEILRIIAQAHATALNPDLRELLTKGVEQSLPQILEHARQFSHREPNAIQVRFIDTKGMERVRVHPGPTVVPQDELQDKSHRSYFQKAISLGIGEVHVTTLDYNMENGEIEFPLNPVMRVVTPVYDAQGAILGVWAVNYSGAELLNFLVDSFAGIDGNVNSWMLNTKGYWLRRSGADQEWALENPDGSVPPMSSTYPRLWEMLENKAVGRDINEQGGFWNWHRSDLAVAAMRNGLRVDSADADLIIASQIPAFVINSQLRGVQIAYGLVALLLAVMNFVAVRLLHARRVNLRLKFIKTKLEEQVSRQQLRDLFDVAPVGLIVVDDKGQIDRVNPEATRMFGYKAEELLGQSIEMLVPHSARQHHPQKRAMYAEHPTTRQMSTVPDLRGLHKDGTEVLVDIALKPTKGTHGNGVLVTVMDISVMRQNQAKLEELNTVLQSKNAELEQFVYSVSHDLKSPIVTQIGYIGCLREDLSEGKVDQALESVDRIEKATNRLKACVDDLLELARIGRVQTERELVAIGPMLNNLREGLSEVLSQANAELILDEPLPTVMVNRQRMLEVFENLIHNAIKYACDADGGTIHVGSEQDELETRLYVRDNGPGIAPEYQTKVFELFQRLDPGHAEGTGIGLTIVKQIMAEVGGRVWIESTPGEGASFWLAFPTG
jgi:hypothetical protein